MINNNEIKTKEDVLEEETPVFYNLANLINYIVEKAEELEKSNELSKESIQIIWECISKIMDIPEFKK